MESTAGERTREGELLAGKYRLERRLGGGGMGEVYRARNELIGRPVAIKVLHAQHAANSEVVSRFLREARAANIVRHPNVVDVLDIGQDDQGVPFIVQELLDGEDLASYLSSNNGRLSVPVALKFLLPVIDAVAVAHASSVVHRDLKPENVFLHRVGNTVVPKVLDFGISKIVSPGEIRMTSTGLMMGTPGYMSPEQIQGSRDIDARTDVWALGVILYEVLSGKLPFEAETPGALFVKICTESPVPLEQVVPDVPAELVRIVGRCLQRDPAQRYANAGELAHDLRNFAAAHGIELSGDIANSPSPTAVSESATRAPTLLGVERTTERPIDRSPGRRRTALVIGGIALVIAGTVGVYALRGRPVATGSSDGSRAISPPPRSATAVGTRTLQTPSQTPAQPPAQTVQTVQVPPTSGSVPTPSVATGSAAPLVAPPSGTDETLPTREQGPSQHRRSRRSQNEPNGTGEPVRSTGAANLQTTVSTSDNRTSVQQPSATQDSTSSDHAPLQQRRNTRAITEYE